MEDFVLIPLKLAQMLKKIDLNQGFKKFLKKSVQKFNFYKNNILNLTPQKVQNLYFVWKNKIQTALHVEDTKKSLQNSVWLENELRTFIYILCVHLYLKKISITELKKEDFILMNEFFPNKQPEHFQYQIKLLLNNKNNKWNSEESRLFQEIMRQNNNSKRWNFIAKQLYIRSSKKYFKTPKQCRERWINHVDPSKKKGNWSNTEDHVLLQSVLNYGKKWTLIVRQLNESRTQNSVKNRYNSLIKMGKKQFGFQIEQQRLASILRQEINKQMQRQQFIPLKIKKDFSENNNEKQDEKKVINKSSEIKYTLNIQKQTFKQTQTNVETLIKAYKSDFQGIIQEQLIDFRNVFEESEQVQNIAWNNSSSMERLQANFYLTDGSFCFQDQNPI